MKYKKLFQPLRIGNMEIRNRIAMPALHTLYAVDGYVTERLNDFYCRRAEGGVGLVFVGGCRIDDFGFSKDMVGLDKDEYIPGLKQFADGMHERGARVAVQLYHAGGYARSSRLPGKESVAPSAVFSKYTKEMPRELTKEEIEEIIRNAARAAGRAKAAGIDMVELSASAGYLVCQFLSPVKNLRTDEYGGSWENRTRFARKLLSSVRETVGKAYPICVRIAGNDFVEGSNTNEDAVAFAQLMEAEGADLLSVTGGWHETTVPQLTGDVPRGGYTYLARAVKDAVSIPVIASNRINDPEAAERVLELEEADMVGICRPLLADPDFPVKALEEREAEIRHCVACNQGCLARTFFGKPVECLVNGYAGRESLIKNTGSSPLKKKILVVGAGPAGCEFAIRAAGKGHQVELWEKSGHIGGQLRLACMPPGKKEFATLSAYFETMLKKQGVRVRLGEPAALEKILEDGPAGYDAVIIASGSVSRELFISGEETVCKATAAQILSGEKIAGRNVVIVGGSSVGCETAQYLAHEAGASPEQIYFLLEHQAETTEKILKLLNGNRRNISVVDIGKIGTGFDPGCGWPVMKDLKRLGVKLYPMSKVLEVKNGCLRIRATDEKTGISCEQEVPCDTLVTAVGSVPQEGLYRELVKRTTVPVYCIGDAGGVGKVIDAIRQADDLAMEL